MTPETSPPSRSVAAATMGPNRNIRHLPGNFNTYLRWPSTTLCKPYLRVGLTRIHRMPIVFVAAMPEEVFADYGSERGEYGHRDAWSEDNPFRSYRLFRLRVESYCRTPSRFTASTMCPKLVALLRW